MNRAEELSVAFLEGYPEAAAQVLDQLTTEDSAAFLAAAPEAIAAVVVGLMQPGRAAALLARSAPEKAAGLLAMTATPARAILLRALGDEPLNTILGAAPKRQAAAMRRYLAHDPGTVGAWMDAPKASFTPDTTVETCLKRLRQPGQRLGSSVLVVGDERRFHGVVDIEALLGAEDSAQLGEIAQREVATLAPQAALTAVVGMKAWDSSLSLPVCDRRRRLVGVLHFDSLREGLVAERGPTTDLRVSALTINLAEAFLVTLSGLLQFATTERTVARFSEERGR